MPNDPSAAEHNEEYNRRYDEAYDEIWLQLRNEKPAEDFINDQLPDPCALLVEIINDIALCHTGKFGEPTLALRLQYKLDRVIDRMSQAKALGE